MAEGEGFEPPRACAHTGFQDRRLQPLGHPSGVGIPCTSLRPRFEYSVMCPFMCPWRGGEAEVGPSSRAAAPPAGLETAGRSGGSWSGWNARATPSTRRGTLPASRRLARLGAVERDPRGGEVHPVPLEPEDLSAPHPRVERQDGTCLTRRPGGPRVVQTYARQSIGWRMPSTRLRDVIARGAFTSATDGS
jgi:hypothetical protein